MTGLPAISYPRISPIRDILHNYVNFSLFERDVIDSTYFQRLHFVLQNSAAYSAYPCNKNSRFVHSLGVSHICGRLFIHGLKNAHIDVLRKFLKEADRFIFEVLESVKDRSGAEKDVLASWRRTVGNSSRFLHNPLIGSSLNHTSRDEFIVNTLWVSLKICGLAHDVGHLPMSHSFEDAIKDVENICVLLRVDMPLEEKIRAQNKPLVGDAFAEDRPALSATLSRLGAIMGAPVGDIKLGLLSLSLHERRSLRILDKIKRNPINEYRTEDGAYRDLVFTIAEVILLSSVKAPRVGHNALLTAMRYIIAGGLDADRLDYVLRDSRASGLELGVFDLDRIVTNCTLCILDDRLQFAFADNSISAIESFFHQRYLIYSALVYHRTAVRIKAVLRELLARLIVFAYSRPNDEVASLLERTGIVRRSQVRSKRYSVDGLLPSTDDKLVNFDDSRLRTMLFDLIAELTPRSDAEKSENSYEIYMIIVLAETFLFRRRENWCSFGKSTASARAYMEKLGIKDVNPFTLGDGLVRTRFRDLIAKKRREIVDKFGGKICLVMSELPPKVYKRIDDEGNKVFVTTRGNSTAVPIEEMSAFLSDQHEIIGREMDWSMSCIGQRIRGSADEHQLEEFFKEIVTSVAELKRATLGNGVHEPSREN